jgi:formylglycine-generating enzyme required for sulfatase activity
LEVPGGTFSRTYPSSNQATLGNFRLDKYEVTVGRFRQFVAAYNAGTWTNAVTAGSGKHTYLNNGQGLANSGSAGGYESGWSASYNGNVAPTTANLSPCSRGDTVTYAGTWTASPASNENRPIDCVNWYEAYAFCIWDGGFLPSQAEWEYAAAGGSQQRVYPWGSTAPGTMCPGTGCEYAIYGCEYPSGPSNLKNCDTSHTAPVGTATLGVGAWGQLDLQGNVWEFNLDWYGGISGTCNNCAFTAPAPASGGRVYTGDSYQFNAAYLLNSGSGLEGIPPTTRVVDNGIRCARAP